jgi:hypothetical protein
MAKAIARIAAVGRLEIRALRASCPCAPGSLVRGKARARQGALQRVASACRGAAEELTPTDCSGRSSRNDSINGGLQLGVPAGCELAGSVAEWQL